MALPHNPVKLHAVGADKRGSERSPVAPHGRLLTTHGAVSSLLLEKANPW
jgi:hypothetical protein